MPVETHPALSLGNVIVEAMIADALRYDKPGALELPIGNYVPVERPDHDAGTSDGEGVIYQRCGGGRRIIRKRIA